MPTIFLKPNSPEFADHQNNRQSHTNPSCDMPGCTEAGEYKAPKDRDLEEYYNFCMEHIKEYNKAWNFFEGMSDSEVREHIIRSVYGDRPTWTYRTKNNPEENLWEKIRQTYSFHDKNFGNNKDPGTHPYNQNSAEVEALTIMNLEPPITLDAIKLKYKMLAKQYHPDLNRGCKESEEKLKEINMAYTVLKIAYEKFEALEKKHTS